MSAVSDYMRKSKASLARALSRSDNEAVEQSTQHAKVVQVGSRLAGGLATAPLSAGLTGFIESRFPNKDGSLAAMGPVPLSCVAGIACIGGSLAAHGNPLVADQLAFAAAGNFGLAAGTAGRSMGAKRRMDVLAKKNGKRGKKKLPAKQPPRAVAGYGYDDEDIPVVSGSDVGNLEDEWSPDERELLGFA